MDSSPDQEARDEKRPRPAVLQVESTDPFGSPLDLELAIGDEPPWWIPGWRDVLGVLPAWWWIGAGLAALLSAGAVYAMISWFNFTLAFGQLFAIPPLSLLALIGYGLRRAVKARQDPFCIFCGYSVAGLGERGPCPECGRTFDVRVCREYRRDPFDFRERVRQSRKLPPRDVALVVPRKPEGDGG